MCEKKSGRRKSDTLWWNEEVKEALLRMKEAHRAMCKNSTEENKRRYKSLKNKAKTAVSKALREKSEEALTELQNSPYWIFRLVKGPITDSKNV